MTISAKIDGTERIIFTPDAVWHEHGQWGPPQNVLFNGQPWEDLTQPPPGWLEMARTLDLTAAKITTRKGRDVIALERTGDGFDLFLCDSQMGDADYEVTILIPRK